MFKKFFNLLHKLAYREQKSIGGAALEMILLTLLVKIFGTVKMSMISGRFGASRAVDIFYAANTIPEVLFNIIAMGSVSAALVPVFTKVIVKEGEKSGISLLQAVLNYTVLLFSFFSLVLFIFAPQIVKLALKINVGGVEKSFSEDDIFMTGLMMRLMLISPIFLGVSAVVGAYLVVNRRFFITRVAPLLYNVGTIIGILIFVPLAKGSVIGLAFGVILSAFLHLISNIPVLVSLGFKFNLKAFSIKKEYAKDIFRLAIPRTISTAIGEIGGAIKNVIAFNLVEGSLAALNFAKVLFSMAVDVLGFTVVQAFFPQLSRLFFGKGSKEGIEFFKYGINQVILLTLPVSVVLLVLRVPVVRMIYGLIGKGFTWEDTIMTSWALLFWSILVVVDTLIAFVLRGFYALEDTKTPLYVSIISLCISVPLVILFVNFFSNLNTFTLFQPYFEIGSKKLLSYFYKPAGSPVAIGGIGFATLITDFIELFILTILFNRKTKFIDKNPFLLVLKKLISSVLMGVSVYGCFRLLEEILNTQRVFHLVIVLVSASIVGFSVFIAAEYLLGDRSIVTFYKAFKMFTEKGKNFLDKGITYLPFVSKDRVLTE